MNSIGVAPKINSNQLSTYLTYDDVLLLPCYSELLPTATDLTCSLKGPKGFGLQLQIPLFSSAMDTVTGPELAQALALIGGCGVLHKNTTAEQQAQWVTQVKQIDVDHHHFSQAAKDQQGRLVVAAAVGVGPMEQQRAALLHAAKVDLLVVDTAHGHSKGVIEMVQFLKARYPKLPVLAGNIATTEAVFALAQAGADGVKIGIGPGSICTTRQVAGVGVPQFEAVNHCASAARSLGLFAIADGGIRYSGDMAKALGVGAHAVMLGSLLAACPEAPGELQVFNGISYKSYRGMGSMGAMISGSKDRYGQQGTHVASKLVPEGVAGLVPAGPSLSEVVYQLMGGLRAAMGYLGAATLEQLYLQAQFIRVSEAAKREGEPHSIIRSF